MPRLAAWIALALALAACGGDAGQELAEWRLGGEVATPADVTLPARLDGVAHRRGTYTLSRDFAVPPAWRGQPLTLWVADLPAVATLAVDGAPALATDPPVPGAYRSRGPLGWRIPGEATLDGALELEFTVDNRWTQSAWWNAAPVMVAGDARPPGAERVLI